MSLMLITVMIIDCYIYDNVYYNFDHGPYRTWPVPLVLGIVRIPHRTRTWHPFCGECPSTPCDTWQVLDRASHIPAKEVYIGYTYTL